MRPQLSVPPQLLHWARASNTLHRGHPPLHPKQDNEVRPPRRAAATPREKALHAHAPAPAPGAPGPMGTFTQRWRARTGVPCCAALAAATRLSAGVRGPPPPPLPSMAASLPSPPPSQRLAVHHAYCCLQAGAHGAALAVLSLALAWPLGDGEVSVRGALEAKRGNGADARCTDKRPTSAARRESSAAAGAPAVQIGLCAMRRCGVGASSHSHSATKALSASRRLRMSVACLKNCSCRPG